MFTFHLANKLFNPIRPGSLDRRFARGGGGFPPPPKSQLLQIVWAQCTCPQASFSSRIRFSRLEYRKLIFNWCRHDFSNISEFRFLHITFSFLKIFQKFQFASPLNRPCSTTLDKCTFFVSRLLWGEICGFLMSKKRNSEIFEKSCLHQLKINLRYSNLENRILLEKLTFKHVHCAHTICRS